MRLCFVLQKIRRTGPFAFPWILTRALKLSPVTIFLFVCVTIVFYQELFSFWVVARLTWHRLQPKMSDSLYFVALLVADPQLQGYLDEPPVIGHLTRYDADKYLEKTFGYAFGYSSPDFVIFLGDLLDEGSRATHDDFSRTVERFKAIYRTTLQSSAIVVYVSTPTKPSCFFWVLSGSRHKQPAKSSYSTNIFIAGDNDVGGEGGEPVTSKNEERFANAFDNSPLQKIRFHFVRFYQGNYFSGYSSPLQNENRPGNDSSTFRILLSHAPLLPSYSRTAHTILSDVKPSLVLSAHDHKAHLFRKSLDTYTRIAIEPEMKPFELLIPSQIDATNRPVYEINVPTCSYRMGVRQMGFGVLLMEQLADGSLLVQVSFLFQPDRYAQLYVYVFVLACGFSYFVAAKLLPRRRT